MEALQNPTVKTKVESVLTEIRNLLIAKWGFDEEALADYHRVILSRFENPFIVDDVKRVARTPIRKLGYDERFIRPIRELRERDLSYSNLLQTVAYVFSYRDEDDPQSVELQRMLENQELTDVVKEVTGVTDKVLVEEIVSAVEKN